MGSWRDEYIKALSERDERERESYSRISEDFIDTCILSPSISSYSLPQISTYILTTPKSPTCSTVPPLSKPRTQLFQSTNPRAC